MRKFDDLADPSENMSLADSDDGLDEGEFGGDWAATKHLMRQSTFKMDRQRSFQKWDPLFGGQGL